MNLLILLNLPEPVRLRYYNHIKTAFPELTVNLVDHNTKVDPYIGTTDILVTFGAHMADHVLEKGRNLKWIQALGTGVDGIVDRPTLRDGVLVTNFHGKHGPPMSEATIALMLALSRNLPRSVRSQSQGKWDRFAPRLLHEKTVGIFGVGAIAKELAPKCKAFGMRVAGITSAKREVPGFDCMYARDELETAVKDLDFLVLLTPLTAETRGIVNAGILAAMKPTSYLVNVARGGVVDEAALVEALKQGRIAGAALDVFTREPLPEDHPFWRMDNVIITPHLGGFHVGYVDEALPIIDDNIRRFVAGDLANMHFVVRR